RSPAEFRNLLGRLAENPGELQRVRRRVLRARERHTWEARAREVVEVLRAVRTRKGAGPDFR
ncbi:MAG: hypothetical protein VYC95_03425, partial [Verrucomicrobiota bacterium]|nr:hypothetical protein [Verrucomicrobiota bacterium]